MTKYRVVGAQGIHGHAPGEEFEGDLDDEAFLLEIGALERLSEAVPEKPEISRPEESTESREAAGDA